MLSSYAKLIGKRHVIGYKPQVWPSKYDNIVIAMSSGVDSSVAATLFADQYPNARGIYMQNWSKSQSLTDPQKEPCYERDWKDACKVANHLNIPIERVNFEQDYWIDVFEPMLEGYREGLTPNPDIGCNTFLKFGKLRQTLDERYGKENYWLVTGHYARIMENEREKNAHLLKAFYSEKDQSYYLSQINADILPQLLFPVGHLTKPEVRKFAESAGLPSASKPDSQGICFVNNSQHGKFKNFLEHYLLDSMGDIVTIDQDTGAKRKWGEHKGLWSYTLGQKIGLSMPQGDPKYTGTWYVSEKVKETNELVIVRGGDNRALFKDTLRVINFKSLCPNIEQMRSSIDLGVSNGTLTMQYRSLQKAVSVVSCTFTNANDVKLKLSDNQRAMAPGQYCCLYLGDRVLGSGVISHTE